MEVRVKDKTINIEPNSKPYLGKRIISELFDLFTFIILFVVIGLGLFKTGIASTYYQHVDSYTRIQDTYKLESGYGEKTYITEDINNSSIIYIEENTNKKYYVSLNKSATNEQKINYLNSLKEDKTYQDEVFGADVHRYMILLLSVGISQTILFLIVPLANKEKSTLGRKLTGIILFNPKTQTVARWYQILAIFLIRFIIEFGLIYLWMGIYSILLVPVIQFIVILINKNNKNLRDFITGTMAIEKLSYSSID